jgi:c-di-GMP-related signal transduction protein
MMEETSFIVREPLLDSARRVLGYEFTWQRADTSLDEADQSGPNDLIELAVAKLHSEESGWQLHDTILYFDVDAKSLSPEIVSSLPAKSTVFRVGADALADLDTQDAVKALRNAGFGISLKQVESAAQLSELLPFLTQVEIQFGSADIDTNHKIQGALKDSSVRVVARGIDNWQDFDAAAALGLDAFIGNLHLTPRPDSKVKGLNPVQTMILQLMQLVRANADVRKLEDVLRRDAALSYKLLRYINSVGFGLGAEIQSLRHAVAMLGYSPLYRWLSLLLATAGGAGSSPVLMQTAVVRGRFAELLGNGYVPKNELENLFVAGMFSLLDRLLGLPMEDVLENIQLSDSVCEALLSRGGMYGPILSLAEACELNNGDVAGLAESLFISPKNVNEAHLSAMVWAQSLKM